MGSRVCAVCKKKKPLEDFGIDRSRSCNRKYVCKPCANIIWKRKWYDKNTDFIRNNVYLRLYGITLDDYNALLKKQGGVCALCGKVNRNKKRLFVDHDHKTGKVRGLLCRACNMKISPMDDEVFFKKALEYIDRGGVS